MIFLFSYNYVSILFIVSGQYPVHEKSLKGPIPILKYWIHVDLAAIASPSVLSKNFVS